MNRGKAKQAEQAKLEALVSSRPQTGWLVRAAALLILGLSAFGCFALSPSPAAASEPSILWQNCFYGSAAGNCSAPRGVAADPDTGNVYVVDRDNFRVNEFSPWGAFLKAWGWGVADGAKKLEVCGPAAAPPTATCRQGIPTTGSGSIPNGLGIAIDPTGNLYVEEVRPCFSGCIEPTNRVQKFSSAGAFILMFGKEVNLTKVAEREAEEAAAEPVTVTPGEENVCTAASGDSCGPGETGSGPGEFGSGPLFSIEPFENLNIAATPLGKIEVGGQEHIQIFDGNGTYEGSISLPGKLVRGVAVDDAGNSYVIFKDPSNTWPYSGPSEDNVVKLSSAGSELCQDAVKDPRSLAIDPDGRLYVVAGKREAETIHRFSPGCVEDAGYSFHVSGLGGFFDEEVETPGLAIGTACGMDESLYYGKSTYQTSFLRAYYPAPDPDLCPPPAVPPRITDQYAASVGSTDATVRAAINPRFWGDTTYYVEYGTEDCASAPDACSMTALLPGAHLDGEADEAVRTAGVFLSGLQPDTTYHFRFVAQSSGGGPVRGLGEAEEDATFTTYPAAEPSSAACANDGLRTGPSAALPDCRAYEMVSPLDKEGGDIFTSSTSLGDRASLNVAAGGGDRFSFSSYRAFGGPLSAPYTSQYLASRGPGGWSTTPISPPQEGLDLIEGAGLDTLYKGFDEELCAGWLWQVTGAQLAPGAIPGYTNMYRRQFCEGGSYEAVTTGALNPGGGGVTIEPKKFVPVLEGFSGDGRRTIFMAMGQLTEDAAPCEGPGNCPSQLYDSHEGELSLVCVLPSGKASTEPCRAGSDGLITNNGRENLVQHAISEDGSRIFWTDGEASKLYVRIQGTETVLLSALHTRFWAASADGSRAIFSTNSGGDFSNPADLYEDEVESNTKTRIAREVMSVLGVSEDAKRIYFASKAVLTGSEENSQGASAEEGRPNLYLYEAGAGPEGEGVTTFIATLSAEDRFAVNALAPLSESRFRQSARVTPDGAFAAFTSTAALTGADNTAAASGQPVTEVFLYDAASKQLRCASCNPTNARPQGHEYEFNNNGTGLWTGGLIPGWPNQIAPSRPLSNDGQRLFFESYEPLVPGDTNGKKDVYEWEAGASAQACREAGAQLFLREEGGCLSLISSGESPDDSSFLDAGRSGRDVFFTTASSLLPQDPGLVDVYDAREGGGFPPPPTPPAACEGEACQGGYRPPQDPTPASEAFEGPGNVQEGKPKRKKHRHRRHAGKHKHKHGAHSHAKRNARSGGGGSR